MPSEFSIKSNVVDVAAKTVTPAEVRVADGKIAAITPLPEGESVEGYLTPGFIDAHVHVESSMLVPTEFARAAVVHGTVGSVSDPHEIGNVLGVEGVRYMLDQGRPDAVQVLLRRPLVRAGDHVRDGRRRDHRRGGRGPARRPTRIGYLSEMMNFPGVLGGRPGVPGEDRRREAARNKPVDGHAPGPARRAGQAAYVAAGMTTDHECFTIDEARDKLAAGCKIAIREGSAARNFDALQPLIGGAPRHGDALQRRQAPRRAGARPHQHAGPPGRRRRDRRVRRAPRRVP